MIGVLALQGAFQKHIECLKLLSSKCCLVKHPHQLDQCSGLIIPGGETTAHLKLIKEDFWKKLLEFGKSKPIMGTCCGLILLSKKVASQDIPTLKFIDIVVSRNAYGRQLESFEDTVDVQFDHHTTQIQGCFIRAPKVLEASSHVKVLAKHNNDPVIVEQGLHIASTFHPEISLDTSLHRYFVEKCKACLLTAGK